MVGHRLPPTGIGVVAPATSVVLWVLTQTDVRHAAVALTWITGSLARAGRPTPNPLPVGAVIMPASDLVAQFTTPDTILPLGVVTGVVGASYLLWLLMRTNRSGAGG